MTSFKAPVSKNTTTWQLKKFSVLRQSYIKIMSISCHMEYKTLIEASCTNNILIGENAKKQNKNKTGVGILWSAWVPFEFPEKARWKESYLCEVNLVIYMKMLSMMLWCCIVIKCIVILKNNILNCWLCFRLFLWHKSNIRL